MTETQKANVLCEVLACIGLSSMGMGLFLWLGLGISLTISGALVTLFGVIGLVRGDK